MNYSQEYIQFQLIKQNWPQNVYWAAIDGDKVMKTEKEKR